MSAPKPILTIAVLSVALTLGACGRRGPLEPHPDAPPTQKAQQKAEDEADRQQAVRPALGGSRRTLSSPIQAPQKPFILDPLL